MESAPGICGRSGSFAPSTIAEYLGVKVNFAEMVDLGGASAAAMVWRAAAAIELGLCNAVLCVLPGTPLTPFSDKKPPQVNDSLHFGGSSNRHGSPQAEFEIPYGTIGQNGPYARVATLYGDTGSPPRSSMSILQSCGWACGYNRYSSTSPRRGSRCFATSLPDTIPRQTKMLGWYRSSQTDRPRIRSNRDRFSGGSDSLSSRVSSSSTFRSTTLNNVSLPRTSNSRA